MAIEVTSDTIVKILIRRGTDSERQNTTLTEGELGYCIDTQRVFIGNGVSKGGVVVGNKFLGFTADRQNFTPTAQVGDLVYQTGSSNKGNTLYAYVPGIVPGDPWVDVHPQPTTDVLQKDNTGNWRIAKSFSGDNSEPHSGFTLQYPGGSPGYSITGKSSRLDFDSRYISLSARQSPYLCSFYLGNYGTKTVSDNLDATLNVDNSIFINTTDTPSKRLKLIADNDDRPGFGLFQSINNGGFDFKFDCPSSLQPLTFYVNNSEALRFYKASTPLGDTIVTIFSGAPGTGSYSFPNVDFRGVSRFKDNVYFDNNADVTIYGNLSVFGDATYLETVVTTTSALSVINNNLSPVPTFSVAQLNAVLPGAGGIAHQPIVRILEGQTYNTEVRPVCQMREEQWVAFNAPQNWSRIDGDMKNYTILGYGDFMWRTHPNADPNVNVVTGVSPGIGIGNGGIDVTNTFNLTAQSRTIGGSLIPNTGLIGVKTGNLTATVDQTTTLNTTTLQVNATTTNVSNNFNVGGNTVINGDTQLGDESSDTVTQIASRLRLANGTSLNNGILFGSNSLNYDVNLYRNAAGVLRTNAALTIDGLITGSNGLTVNAGTGSVQIHTNPGGTPSSLTVSGEIRAGTSIGHLHQFDGNVWVSQDIIAYSLLSPSDINLKTNITKIPNPLETLDKISGVSFNWNEKTENSGKKDYGVIAQEIESVLPELVRTNKDGYKVVNYDKIIPILIEAIKELNKRNK